MRSISYIHALLVVVISATGCGNFLEEYSQDSIKPSSVQDLVELMLGEGYSTNDNFAPFIDLLTDDVQSSYPLTSDSRYNLVKWEPMFVWDPEMFDIYEETIGNTTYIDTWQQYYKYIGGCNVILDQLPKVTGSEADKENLRGQALTMRAFYYFMLANYFCEPYNQPGIDLSQTLGVALVTTSNISATYPGRGNLADVYTLIEESLTEALPLLEQYGQNNNKYRATDMFVNMALSRLYLYQEKWDESISYSTVVIEEGPGLTNLASTVSSTGQVGVNVCDYGSAEAIWLNGRADTYSYVYTKAAGDPIAPYSVSDELYGLYEHGATTAAITDIRRLGYFMRALGTTAAIPLYAVKSTQANNTAYAVTGFRVAEAYMNRAEAYIMKYIAAGDETLAENAIADINELRRHRFADGTFVAKTRSDFATPQDLLTFCREERRREFPFEGHRFFDLRRWGRPQIVHSYQYNELSPAVNIAMPPERYVLRIPATVLERNPNLQQNP